jgi:hypothetical protein
MRGECIECGSRNTEWYDRDDGRGKEKRCLDCGYQSHWHDKEDDDGQTSLDEW